MDNAITAGLSRQIVLQRALEVTANNVANQSTAGFKSERLAFREYIAELDIGAPTPGSALGSAPGSALGGTPDPFVSLAFDPNSFTDFAPGTLNATYGDFDFAIDGPGFFAVETEAGVRYTRDGRFSVNAVGELVTQSGARVLDDQGSAILLDPTRGALSVTPEGGLQQGTTPVAAIGVFEFAAPQGLARTGDNLFEAIDAPQRADRPRIRQGFLEAANGEPIRAMTDMIEILRAYQQTTELIQTANELSREAIDRLGDIN